MIEKRKPTGNVGPYCEQMQVLNDWQIVPLPDVEPLRIEEEKFGDAQGHVAGSARVRRRALVDQLRSKCVCEWVN